MEGARGELSLMPRVAELLEALLQKVNSGGDGKGPQETVIETPFTFADFAGGSKASATSIPAGASVQFAYVLVTTVFDGAATLDLGQTGSTSLLIANTLIDLTQLGMNGGPSGQPWGATALPVLMTFGGAPTQGAGKIIVIYATPKL